MKVYYGYEVSRERQLSSKGGSLRKDFFAGPVVRRTLVCKGALKPHGAAQYPPQFPLLPRDSASNTLKSARRALTAAAREYGEGALCFRLQTNARPASEGTKKHIARAPVHPPPEPSGGELIIMHLKELPSLICSESFRTRSS